MRLVRLLLALTAIAAFAAPIAQADPPDVSVTLTGTLERTHEDTATGARPIDVLSTADGPQVVTFAAGQPVPPNGMQVALHGRLANDTLRATSATVVGPNLAMPSSAAADGGGPQVAGTYRSPHPFVPGAARSVAIVVITFGNGATPGYTDAQLHGVMVSDPNSVSNYFSEQSYGQVSFDGLNNPDGDIFRVSIPAVPDSSCAWDTWGSEADSAVGSAVSSYDHVIYVFNSGGNCGFAGLAYIPGSQVWIDDYFQLSVVAHELGHNLGVHHASALRCTSAGQIVAFSGTCTSDEYGDPYDIMGDSNTNQQNAFHKYQSGWLGAVGGARVRSITASGDYTISPLEQSSGVALLLVPGVTGSSVGQDFALDLRQTYGTYFDAFAAGSAATAGIQIHLVQAPTSGSQPIQTQLIDATPQTTTGGYSTANGFADAALTPGNSFTDSTDQITVQTLSIDPLVGATVRITLHGSAGTADTTPPTAVSSLTSTVASGPVVSLAFGSATDDRGIASYRVTRDGSPLATLGSTATGYADWTPTVGTHVYGVTAVDLSGNAGPTVTSSATIAAPPPVTVLPVIVVPVPLTPNNKILRNTPAAATPTATTRLAIHVKTTVIARHGRTRRVRVSWSEVDGAHRYVVTRNGHTLGSTTARSLVDAKAPTGSLRYVIRVPA
ncbi:MAG TPA: hypothetical protein VGF46_08590 [Gaiellales bacterium]